MFENVRCDGGDIGVGAVEDHQVGIGHAALEKRVHAAAVAVLTGAGLPGQLAAERDLDELAAERRKDARAADLVGQQAAGGEVQVADDLGLDADAVLPSQAAGSADRSRRSRCGDATILAIGGRRDDLADQRLAAPAAAEAARAASQSSSSGCVGGSPRAPKSSGVRTRPLAEQVEPDLIDGHARRQRVGRIDEPAGQVEAGGGGCGVPARMEAAGRAGLPLRVSRNSPRVEEARDARFARSASTRNFGRLALPFASSVSSISVSSALLKIAARE